MMVMMAQFDRGLENGIALDPQAAKQIRVAPSEHMACRDRGRSLRDGKEV